MFFHGKRFQPLFFSAAFLSVRITEGINEMEGFFYKRCAALLDSLLQVVNGSSEVRGRSLKQSCNLQLFLYQVRNSQEIKQEIVSGRNKSCVVRTCL